MKPLRPIRWEGSAADRRADRRNARKAGVSVATWEKSKADERADAAARARIRRGRAKK